MTCADEKLDEIHTALETSPRKLFLQLAEQTGLCVCIINTTCSETAALTSKKQIRYINSPTQIMKQERIFFSNTVQQAMAFLNAFIGHNMLNF